MARENGSPVKGIQNDSARVTQGHSGANDVAGGPHPGGLWPAIFGGRLVLVIAIAQVARVTVIMTAANLAVVTTIIIAAIFRSLNSLPLALQIFQMATICIQRAAQAWAVVTGVS